MPKSHTFSGLLRAPDGSAHVTLYRDGFLSIFLPAFPWLADVSAIPATADLDRWVQRVLAQGVEAASILPGVPFPMTVHARLVEVGADGRLRTHQELHGMAQQPWAGLLMALYHRFRGDPTAPMLPAGYTFTPAVSTAITRSQAAEC